MGEIREVNGEKADERESSHSLGYYTINTNQPLLPSFCPLLFFNQGAGGVFQTFLPSHYSNFPKKYCYYIIFPKNIVKV